MTIDDAIHRAAEDSKDHKGHRLIWVSFTVFLLGVIVLAVVVLIGRADNEDLSTQVGELSQQSRSNADVAAKLAEQVRALGAVPVAEPPNAAASVDPAVLRQAARDAVEDYCAPRNGCRGADGSTPDFDAIVTAVVARVPAPANGRDGENATTAQVAAAVAAYCGGPAEPCRGPAGGKGADGESPPCLAEPAQCRGPTGDKGEPGEPGPTCPDGYTAQSRRQGAETWWVCVSDADPSLPIPN